MTQLETVHDYSQPTIQRQPDDMKVAHYECSACKVLNKPTTDSVRLFQNEDAQATINCWKCHRPNSMRFVRMDGQVASKLAA